MKSNPYASFFERLLSRFIDFTIYSMIILVPVVKITTINELNLLLNNIYNFILFLLLISSLILFFEVFMITKFGGTLGKLLIGLRIQKENGKKLSFKESFFRLTLGRAVSSLFFCTGYFWIFKNAKRQAWHDMITEAVVIKKLSFGWLIGIILLISFVLIDIGVFTGIIVGFIDNYSFYQNLKF